MKHRGSSSPVQDEAHYTDRHLAHTGHEEDGYWWAPADPLFEVDSAPTPRMITSVTRLTRSVYLVVHQLAVQDGAAKLAGGIHHLA